MRVFVAALLFATIAHGAPLCSDFQSALKTVRFVPYVADGVLQGYVIHGLKKGSVVAQSGLEELDLLMEIDGVRLNDPKVMQSSLDGLCKTKGAAHFSLLRSGKPLALTIAFSQTPR